MNIAAAFATRLAADVTAGNVPYARGFANIVGTDTHGNVRVYHEQPAVDRTEIESDTEWTCATYRFIDTQPQFRGAPRNDLVYLSLWSKNPELLGELAARANELLHEHEAELNDLITDDVRVDMCVEMRRLKNDDEVLSVQGVVVQYQLLSYDES